MAHIKIGHLFYTVNEIIEAAHPDEAIVSRIKRGDIDGAKILATAQMKEGRDAWFAGREVYDFEPLARRIGYEYASTSHPPTTHPEPGG